MRILNMKEDYIRTIHEVMRFLQGKLPTMAHLISKRGFLPEASRFAQADDLKWAFGSMGTQDRAKYLATMYLEDLSDLIKDTIDPHFGFSRYAESLARSANSFDELYKALSKPLTYLDTILIEILQDRIEKVQPKWWHSQFPFLEICILPFVAVNGLKSTIHKLLLPWVGDLPIQNCDR